MISVTASKAFQRRAVYDWLRILLYQHVDRFRIALTFTLKRSMTAQSIKSKQNKTKHSRIESKKSFKNIKHTRIAFEHPKQLILCDKLYDCESFERLKSKRRSKNVGCRILNDLHIMWFEYMRLNMVFTKAVKWIHSDLSFLFMKMDVLIWMQIVLWWIEWNIRPFCK